MTQQFLINQGNLVKPEVDLLSGTVRSMMSRVKKAWLQLGRVDIADEFAQRATAIEEYPCLFALAEEYAADVEEEEDEDE